MPDSNSFSRRNFLLSSSAAMAASAASAPPLAAQGGRKLKVGLVDTGGRGTGTWGKPVQDGYSDVVEFVGLCDINGKRVKVAQGMIGTSAPTFTDFDEMVKTTNPDAVMITTPCGTHWRYIVRGL